MQEKIIEILGDYVDLDGIELNDDTKLRGEIGLNSFDLVNVVVELEREFDVKIEDKEAAALSTLGELTQLIKSKQ